MVSNVCSTNLVVQKVNESKWIKLIIWAIDGVESALYKVMVFVGKVRNINVGMLEPASRKEISTSRTSVLKLFHKCETNSSRKQYTSRDMTRGTHHVYTTNQQLTTRSGPPYIAIISGNPLVQTSAPAAAATTATPTSD